MKIVVLTPCYNEELRLDSYINSIKNQTLKTDLIALDDGSKDATGRILEESQILHSEKNDKNLGIIRSFNKLLDIARRFEPDYITWGGVDEELYPESIEKRVESLEKSGTDLVFAGADTNFYGVKMVYPALLPQLSRMRHANFERLHEELLLGNFLQAPMIKLRKVNFEDLYIDLKTKHFCDWDQYLRLSGKYKASFVDEALGCIGWDGENFSKPNPALYAEKFREMLYVLKKYPKVRPIFRNIELVSRSTLVLRDILKTYVRRFKSSIEQAPSKL